MSVKRPPASKPAGAIDWTGVKLRKVEFAVGATIFTQGDPAASVMYIERGTVRLTVMSHAGKEAVIAVLGDGDFFGEGCLVGQAQRMATASTMAAGTIILVEKQEWIRQLHRQPALA